jgi:hypothetical protein
MDCQQLPAVRENLVNHATNQTRPSADSKMLEGRDGIDYVRCRICGEHRRVITGAIFSSTTLTGNRTLSDMALAQMN